MANNIIIRKAKADYVCQVCGHIIKAGTDYLDRVVLNNGKCVQHERYHDECPHNSDVSKLFARIERENGDLICCDGKGCKIHIVGIAWNNKGPMFLYREWTANKSKVLPIECIYSLIDTNGDAII